MELHAFEEMAQSMDHALQEDDILDCKPTSVFPPVTPPGMAYVPYQQWGDVYSSEKGFKAGTMFPVLNYPFMPNGGDCEK